MPASASPIRGLRRLLFDRVLPALFFGIAAVVGVLGLIIIASRGPTEAGLEGWVLFVLGLGHMVLSALFMALIATLFLIRRAPSGPRAKPWQMAVALIGAFVINLATLQGRTLEDWRLLASADLLLIAGLAFSLYAALCLRQCFSVAPEARGLVTSGAYRLVRHPLYLGEFVAFLGMMLPFLSLFTVAVYAVFAGFQAARMRMEEQVLLAAFPEYADYRRRTPALLPWPRSQ